MMSETLLQEAKKISGKLSDAEKMQLFDWLSSQLHQDLEDQQAQTAKDEQTKVHATNGHSTQSTSAAAAVDEEVETPWTLEEVQAMIKPEPKSGAQIAAMIRSGEIDTSIGAEMEIPDVVVWLENLRRQERLDRELEE